MNQNDKEYVYSLINNIINLENQYSKLFKLNYKSQELFGKKLLKKKMKKLKFQIKTYQEEYDRLKSTNSKIYNEIGFDILKLDYLFKEDNYSIFINLKVTENPKSRLRTLNILFNSFAKLLHQTKSDDYDNKRKIKEVLSFIRLRIIIEKENIKSNVVINTKKEEIKSKKNKFIDDVMPKRYYDVINAENIENEKLSYAINSYLYLIRNDKLFINIDEYLDLILSRISKENIEDYIDSLYSILDSLKYRKLSLEKYNKQEKKIIKNCMIKLRNYLDYINLMTFEIKDEHDYKFDIIDNLLLDSKNYNVIRQLIKEYPKIVNTRINKISLVEYVIKLYTENFKKVLTKEKYDYNVDYLKEVYKLFMQSDSLYLNSNDIENINNIISNHIKDIISIVTNPSKKDKLIKETKKLFVERYIKEESNYKNVNEESLRRDIKDIFFLDSNHTNRFNEVDLTCEHTFMLTDEYTCYSFVEEKGYKILKIHTCDISNIVDENSNLENYLYNLLLEGRVIDFDILSYLKFKEGDITSAFTYEIKFDDDIKIKDFKVYKSKIKVDGDILSYTDNEYLYKSLKRIINETIINDNLSIDLNGLKKIEYILEQILSKIYLNKLKQLGIYSIAQIHRQIDVVDSETYGIIKEILSKMSKDEAYKIDTILSTTIDEYHFANNPKSKDDIKYYLIGQPCFIHLLNQRMLKTFLINEGNIDANKYLKEKEKYNIKYYELANLLNQLLDYKSQDDFDYKKKKNKKYTLTFIN